MSTTNASASVSTDNTAVQTLPLTHVAQAGNVKPGKAKPAAPAPAEPVTPEPVAVPTLAELVGERTETMLAAYLAIDGDQSRTAFRLAYFTDLKDVRVIDALTVAANEETSRVSASTTVSALIVDQVTATFLRESSVDLSSQTVAAVKVKRERAKKDLLTAINVLAVSKHYARIRDLVAEGAKQGVSFQLADFLTEGDTKLFAFLKGDVIHVVKVSATFKAVALSATGQIYVKNLQLANVAVDGLAETVKNAFSLSEFTTFDGQALATTLANKDNKGRVIAYTDLAKAFTGLTNNAIAVSYAAFPDLKDGIARLIETGATKADIQDFIGNQKARFTYALKGANQAAKSVK